MFQTKKEKTMKKTFWSLAALMLMAAPMMTSCSNDEVAPVEEVKSNVVTITIAPPAPKTRVAMDADGLTIAGWEVGDEVTLYKMAYTGGGAEGTPASTLTGAGVTFTCKDAVSGTFSGDLGENNIDDYTLAVYGATAKLEDINGSNYVVLLPNTMCAEELKDVVIMAAMKDNDGKYAMEVVNNVMKIKNGSAADVEVAWSQEQKYYEGNIHFFTPLSGWIFDDVAYDWIWTGAKVYPTTLSNYTGWENAEKFTLKAGVDSYVNMGLCGNTYEKWGLAKEDGTEILPKKQMTSRANGVKGKLYNAGTVGAASVAVTAINFDYASLDLKLDEDFTLIPEVLPNDATDNTLTWSSDKESVATVVDGVVTAVGVGTANITATANDGSGVTTTIPVTVGPGEVVFDKNNSNVTWNGSGTSTLSATDSKSGITLTLTRSNGYINRASAGAITFQYPEANDELTVSVTGRTIVSVTNSATSKTLQGTGPWTLTYKTTTSHSVPSNGWYTSGGDAFIGANIPSTKKLTVVYE